ncbi:dUTP diphosphatase [Candidatus Albibeggiatoa sp. nov. BB20]|uniref:dUTP diphosphatase n=1 Tax=Candidatus Albibeggiatoa sp. nov. BB20 TaxID=3162723 RepID=UPI0033659D93
MTAQNPSIELKILNPLISDKLPQYQTIGSAGMDLIACIDSAITLSPNETQLINTGFAINIRNPSLCAMIYPRSGLGVKGIILANNVGVIDSDYQGEIKVALLNRSQNAFVIEPFSRIAQMVFQPVTQVQWDVVDAFHALTERGAGGFGSTGH